LQQITHLRIKGFCSWRPWRQTTSSSTGPGSIHFDSDSGSGSNIGFHIRFHCSSYAPPSGKPGLRSTSRLGGWLSSFGTAGTQLSWLPRRRSPRIATKALNVWASDLDQSRPASVQLRRHLSISGGLPTIVCPLELFIRI